MYDDFLQGWTRYPMADGLIFVPPAGPDEGLVRVREGQPLRPFRAVIDDLVRDGGDDYRRTAIGRLRRFVTWEGESAGVVTLVVTPIVERTVALVAGDSTCLIVDGATGRPDLFDRYRLGVRDLAASWYFGLGHARRRRFSYLPPKGWPVVARRHAATYVDPARPSQVSITVFDAWPRGRAPALGQHAGDEILCKRAVQYDERFVYCAELETRGPPDAEAAETFAALVRSIATIPAASCEGASLASNHWVE